MNEFLGKSLVALFALIKEGQTTGEEVRRFYLKRINTFNKKLNVYLTVVDKPTASGIPIAVKDNFCTKGIVTTASSKVLDSFIPPYESTVTSRLLDHGMSILGKTNMDAWAHGASTETSDYGVTKNPYDISRVAGGSSGGSAAAVAAGAAPGAIGSDTGGSIRGPASWCGVVGLKPTYGRVSRYGLIAMGSSWDCPGLITQTVEDTALLLHVIAGKDPFDATSADIPVDDYRLGLQTKQTFTLGIPEEYFEGVDEEIIKVVNQCIGVLSRKGHRVKKVKLVHPKYAISVYTILQRSEVASNLARYDGIRYGAPRRFFGAEAERRIMLGTYTLSYGYYDAYYRKAQQVREVLTERFAETFQNVDFVMVPTMPKTALKIGEWKKYPFFGELMDRLNEPASASGIPAITMPIGFNSQGLPIGIQIMGRQFDEARLLNMAYQVEAQVGFDRFKVMKRWQ